MRPPLRLTPQPSERAAGRPTNFVCVRHDLKLSCHWEMTFEPSHAEEGLKNLNGLETNGATRV
jgi:hypothetical protein